MKEKKAKITFGQILLMAIDVGLLLWIISACNA